MPSVCVQGGRFVEFWKRASMSASERRGFSSGGLSLICGGPGLFAPERVERDDCALRRILGLTGGQKPPGSDVASGRTASPPAGRESVSSCSPKFNDGSTNREIAAKGMRSGWLMPPNFSVTSNRSSWTWKSIVLVLEDDGHLVGELVLQVIRHLHALQAGAEGDVEMMVARQVAQLRTAFAKAARTTARNAACVRS
jgi:hypothetical protein